MKLGKLAPKKHAKTLDLRAYLLEDAPLPTKVYWEYKVPPANIGMYGNDEIGDCTCAAIAHYVELATAHTRQAIVPDPREVVEMYSKLSGYDATTGANDNGVAITDALDYWQGVGLSGHKILGWVQVNFKDLSIRHKAIWLFGGLIVGVQLPANAQDQFAAGKPWEVSWWNNHIEGGHCILETGYGSQGSNFQTWGKGDQKASNAWTSKYMDEAYAVITQDWLDQASGIAPSHLDLPALQKALDSLRG